MIRLNCGSWTLAPPLEPPVPPLAAAAAAETTADDTASIASGVKEIPRGFHSANTHKVCLIIIFKGLSIHISTLKGRSLDLQSSAES